MTTRKEAADVDTKDTSIPLLDRAEPLALDRDVSAGPSPEYTPLWDAESGIRQRLAADSATKRMTDALAAVETKMVEFGKEHVNWEIKHTSDESLPEPQSLNLAEIASAHGLTVQQTGLLAPAEMFEKFAGLADSTVVGRSMMFARLAYTGDLQPYTTVASTDSAGNQYVAWITEISPEHVPELADIKEEVISAWRFAQARPLALARADELATEARKSGDTLAQAFADRSDLTVVTTGAFTWLTTGMVPQFSSPILRISEIDGVDLPGSKFMQTAFALSAGEVGVAMNQPESIAYVIRVTSEDTPAENLRSDFLASNQDMYLQVGQADVQQLLRTWRADLVADAGVHWERPAIEETRR
ncbi:MAG: hypothetical protein R3C10_13300 [Pirellulales bacterium]